MGLDILLLLGCSVFNTGGINLVYLKYDSCVQGVEDEFFCIIEFIKEVEEKR